jgi:DNA recombination protein RmuC
MDWVVLMLLVVVAILLYLVFRSAESSERFVRLESLLRTEIAQNREEFGRSSRESRQDLVQSFAQFETQTHKNFALQLQNLEKSVSIQQKLKEETERKLDSIREVLENRLRILQTENERKLEEMRRTVDEKLQSTLEKRLSESFNLVSERLQAVHEGLGEMKTLATGVGDLKKILGNVKTGGMLGEVQLEAILENILAPGQFSRNQKIKLQTRETVEFAIKLPGLQEGEFVFLPIDSKFPIEKYAQLSQSYQTGEKSEIEAAAKTLRVALSKSAKEIAEKYIAPPQTTDFAIMFLPFESLYAEAVREPGFLETLQREYKIIITGPTTLAAILNSLQMGFRTLAIQKRSADVWKVLAQVKKEFDSFGKTLITARKNIDTAGKQIDELVFSHSDKIEKSLRNVELFQNPNPELS